MKLFLIMFLALILAAGATFALASINPDVVHVFVWQMTVNVPGNVLFLITTSILIAILPDVKLNAAQISFATAGIIGLIIALVIFGMVISEFSLKTALPLLGLMGSLGCYPSGPDVPFEFGASIWAGFVVFLILLSVGLGIRLRRVVASSKVRTR